MSSPPGTHVPDTRVPAARPPVDGRAAPATVTVSPMRRRHLRAVMAIEQQVYPRPWSVRLFEDELDRSGRVYLVARVGPVVVGYAGLLMIADDGHVATVAVHPEWQGRGVAVRLMAELVQGAIELGANQLTLEVRVSNQTAQAIYRRFGFAPAGARKAYYADNGEDALVMWAHDVTGPVYRQRLREIVAAFDPPTVRQGFAATATATNPDTDPATALVAHPTRCGPDRSVSSTAVP